MSGYRFYARCASAANFRGPAQAGEYSSAPFQIGFACESTVVSGVATGKSNVAMGLLAPESSVNSAWGFNLITGKTVTWLLDTQYGAPGGLAALACVFTVRVVR